MFFRDFQSMKMTNTGHPRSLAVCDLRRWKRCQRQQSFLMQEIWVTPRRKNLLPSLRRQRSRATTGRNQCQLNWTNAYHANGRRVPGLASGVSENTLQISSSRHSSKLIFRQGSFLHQQETRVPSLLHAPAPGWGFPLGLQTLAFLPLPSLLPFLSPEGDEGIPHANPLRTL